MSRQSPPNRPRLNLQHPCTHEALRMHSASILLSPLLRLDLTAWSLCSPATARSLDQSSQCPRPPDIHLDEAASNCHSNGAARLPRSCTRGVRGVSLEPLPVRASPPHTLPNPPTVALATACRRVSAQVGYLNRLRVIVILCRTPLEGRRRDPSAKPWERPLQTPRGGGRHPWH